MKHHIWCNYQNPFFAGQDDGEPEGSCSMCVGLKKNYPEIENDKDADELRKKHFPNVKVVR